MAESKKTLREAELPRCSNVARRWQRFAAAMAVIGTLNMEIGAVEQVRVAEGERPTPGAVDTDRTSAWLRRQIVFEHEPVERVAQEFNRYAQKQIEIVTPALRHLEISGVFATDDTGAFIAFLRSLDGVQIEVTAARIRVSQNK